MKESRLNVTLVGVGGYGGTHLKSLRQLQEEGFVRLTDVVDPSPERFPEVKKALCASGVRWHRSWEELLLVNPFPDCVTIAAPIHFHLDYAIRAYATGAYVYLEKPPVPLIGQIDELIAMERGAEPRIQVGFAFPYSTQMRTLKRWSTDGSLGKILSYRMTGCFPRGDDYYNRSSWAGKLAVNGNPVLDGPATNALAHRIHDLLTIESFASETIGVPKQLQAELYRARPLESYDVCSARGVFQSGATFAFSLYHATSAPKDFILEVNGEKGSAQLTGSKLELTSNFTSERIRGDDEMIVISFRNFFATAQRKGRPEVGLLETRPYVVTTNAMALSSGGIHPISDEHYQKVPSTRGEIYHVIGLSELSGEVFRQGLNFAEVGASWGVPGEAVSPAEISAVMAEQSFAKLIGSKT